VKSLKHNSFPEMAERACALYNKEEDTLLLGMFGQEYEIRHDGIFVRSQKAPDTHGAVILDYLFSKGTVGTIVPWRTLGDFGEALTPGFRKKVEEPISSFITKIITRANTLLPMLDAKPATSLIGSDLAITVRALPKVFLHLELSQETQDFPAEAWMLFSNNANEFLTVPNLHVLAEIFKDRLLGLLRIY
jgi:Domain of unknown function (DUF3786)